MAIEKTTVNTALKLHVFPTIQDYIDNKSQVLENEVVVIDPKALQERIDAITYDQYTD